MKKMASCLIGDESVYDTPLKEPATVYKIVREYKWHNFTHWLLELEIPAGAKVRLGPTTGKCRAEVAVPKRCWIWNGKQRRFERDPDVIHIDHTKGPTRYRIGKKVRPDEWWPFPDECRAGIHFFRKPEHCRRWFGAPQPKAFKAALNCRVTYDPRWEHEYRRYW